MTGNAALIARSPMAATRRRIGFFAPESPAARFEIPVVEHNRANAQGHPSAMSCGALQAGQLPS